jgi:hypothetical protein
MAVDLPKHCPKLGDTAAAHAAWTAKATRHGIVGTWRPVRGDNAPLVIRLDNGGEIAFDSIAEACRPDRFFAAFIGIDGVPMPAYSGPQVRDIVAALIRMARIDRESDELDEVRDIGSRYVTACLAQSTAIVARLDEDGGEYRAAVMFAKEVRFLTGDDPHERLPAVLHATDRNELFVSRGLFGKFARRALSSRVTHAAFNGRMVRAGWVIADWRPRPPGDRDGYRPHLRLWQIEAGWEGVSTWVPPSEDKSPENTEGPAWSRSTGARTPSAYFVDIGGTQGPKPPQTGNGEGRA